MQQFKIAGLMLKFVLSGTFTWKADTWNTQMGG